MVFKGTREQLATLRNHFKYENGELICIRDYRKHKIGDTLKGWPCGGYLECRFENFRVYKHRLIFFHVNGYLPGLLDHKDRDKNNNEEWNLRPASKALNTVNTEMFKNNTSGYKGVSLYKPTGRFSAQIKIDQKKIFLGYFDTAEEAYEVRLKAEEHYWGDLK